MKTYLTAFSLLFSLSFLAQTHVIVKHNGERIKANYIKTNNNIIYYNSGQDQINQTISTYAVAELVDATTNVSTKISDKIIVNGEQDYKKVIVIAPNATTGLSNTPIDFKLKNRVKGQTPIAIEQQNINTLKRNAAKQGFPFVAFTPINRAESSASMYTY